MAGKKIERARVGAAGGGLEVGIALHVGEKTRRAVGVESGARRNADADAVGFEFLGAREGRQCELRFGERQCSDLRIAQYVIDHMVDDRDLPCLLLADRSMVRDHMAHFMRQHGCKLGLVIGEGDQSARDIEPAVGKREGVDRRRVENGDLIFQVRSFGRRHQTVDGFFDHVLQARVVIFAAIGRKNSGMLALGLRARPQPGGGVCGTGSETRRCSDVLAHPASSKPSDGRDRERALRTTGCQPDHAVVDSQNLFTLTSSICSGVAASITGPLRCSIHPRTRTRCPSSRFGSMPLSANSRR